MHDGHNARADSWHFIQYRESNHRQASEWSPLTGTAVAGVKAEASNSRLVENRSDTVGKEQLASLAFRSDSMLAVDGCSLVFLEGRVFN